MSVAGVIVDPFSRPCHLCGEPVGSDQPARVLISGWVHELGGGLAVDEDRANRFPVAHEWCVPEDER